MNDMNLGQIFNLFMRTNTGRNPQNLINSAQNAVNNTGAENIGQKMHAPAATPRVNVNFKAQSTPQTPVQLAQLSNADTSVYVKNLLNLPQTMEDFLLMMTTVQSQTKAMVPKDIANLLLTSNLDLSKMVVFLQQNGKEALSKLIQMTANFNQMGADVKGNQMNELAAIINASVSTAGASQNQALKSFLLLYLPWLPLGENTNFSIEIGSGADEEQGESNDSITILISTQNYGNVKIILFKEGQKAINMQISCSKDFPKEEVHKAISEEAKSYNIQAGVDFEEKNVSKPEKQENLETKVSLNTSPGVNPFLILMAHSVIKIVITIDKACTLLKTRKKNIE